MNSDKKEMLARTGDSSKEAIAARLKAARTMTRTSQGDLGKAVGVKNAAISNMESARSFVTIDVMRHFHREHRIDFNFFIAGLYSQLPEDVQELLFDALDSADRAAGPEASSD
ncbi:MAG TPA: hypothetical protein DIT67_01570 [Octadecabacter sp.]|nr:hypothetical protein [Octadecabacter sp.]